MGSTGSIGRSALDVVRLNPGRFDVVGLAARRDVRLLSRQIDEFHPSSVAVDDEGAAAELQGRYPKLDVRSGTRGVTALAGEKADVVLCAIVGAAGLEAVLSAIEGGNRIALANKEPLVMAGGLIMEAARTKGVEVLPVDSEHNAIFQCLQGHRVTDVYRVYLTASGGPFYGRPRDSLAEVSPEEATNHPTWDMGAKISVDSATLMNKGLEVIEAMWLFDLPLDTIDVVIHPQSIVHGLVEFCDGTILAHLGATDMKLPIQFALTWPKRVESPVKRLDLTAMRDISFATPDFREFPCLAYALEAARKGGTTPTVLNAANEVAVEAFSGGRIPFLHIAEVVHETLETCARQEASSLDAILTADGEARRAAERAVEAIGVKFT